MEVEKGRISSSQLTFLVISFGIGIAVVIPPGTPVKQDAWLVIIFGLIEGIILTLVYLNLSGRFPGKTLVEISDIVYGPYLGKVISFLFILYLFHVSSLLVIDFSNFFSSVVLVDTPFPVLMILITLVAASAVRNGIEIIARCSQVLLPIVLGSIILTSVLLLKDYDLSNFQPVLQTPPAKMVWYSQRTAIISFSSAVFMMIIPSVNKQSEVKRAIIKGTIIAAFFLILMTVRNIAVLGNTMMLYTFPSFKAVRLINIGQIITRMEILVALNFLAGGFLEFTLFFYSTVLGGAQLFGLRTYLPLVLPVGVLITFQLHFYNIAESIEYQDIFPVVGIIFKLVIPLLTLCVAIIRKLPREG